MTMPADQSVVPDPQGVITMLKGFVMTIEDLSRGSFSDEAAHRFLAAINEESAKMLAALARPDLVAGVVGSRASDEESAKAHAAAEKWCSICRRITDHDAGAHYRGEARTGAASPSERAS